MPVKRLYDHLPVHGHLNLQAHKTRVNIISRVSTDTATFEGV
ncbi:hypothetical protein ACFQZX_08890 [Mucilaginibacter litoreus]|uniref:Uncharacterized protein n=1 Tax=Mucilaginibacter litoreus TaxID=1048221 RepID=A0ABW3ART2_9SPHI